MKGARLLVALAAAILFAAPAARGDGTPLRPLDRRDLVVGWRAVGRVDVDGGGYCTGALIDTALVLTAAHCIFRSGTETLIDPASITFRAGYGNGDAVAERRAARIVAHPAYSNMTRSDVERRRHDVALLQLARPIPTATAPAFTVRPPGDVREVSVVSYASGRDQTLSRQRSCNVLGRYRGILAFDCDVYFGSSGAPVFDMSGRRAAIVAVMSGIAEADGRRIAYGVTLPGLVADLKRALRTGEGVAESSARPDAPIRRLRAGDGKRDTDARFLRP